MSKEISRILQLSGVLNEGYDYDQKTVDDGSSEEETVTVTLTRDAAEWLKDHLSAEECEEGSCEEVQDALEEALCPECEDDTEAGDELEDDLGLDE